MSESSHDHIRGINRIRHYEPVTIKLYGVKEISLPTYLMWYLATIIVVVALIAGCKEVMQPQTKTGVGIRQSIERECCRVGTNVSCGRARLRILRRCFCPVRLPAPHSTTTR
jgi:hypothetical protein